MTQRFGQLSFLSRGLPESFFPLLLLWLYDLLDLGSFLGFMIFRDLVKIFVSSLDRPSPPCVPFYGAKLPPLFVSLLLEPITLSLSLPDHRARRYCTRPSDAALSSRLQGCLLSCCYKGPNLGPPPQNFKPAFQIMTSRRPYAWGKVRSSFFFFFLYFVHRFILASFTGSGASSRPPLRRRPTISSSSLIPQLVYISSFAVVTIFRYPGTDLFSPRGFRPFSPPVPVLTFSGCPAFPLRSALRRCVSGGLCQSVSPPSGPYFPLARAFPRGIYLRPCLPPLQTPSLTYPHCVAVPAVFFPYEPSARGPPLLLFHHRHWELGCCDPA